MPHHDPPGVIAPHVPADTYRHAEATGAPVVLVVLTHPPGTPARRYLIPLALAGAGTLGTLGLVAAFFALLDFAAHTATTIGTAAGPIGIGGLTFKLTRTKTH
ncbi:hypothetical protein SLNWT_3795 [Streptomyces albus]|uniref:Uncharacterized protein n=1 Tax=Streptomyces albus (strain ATCC 21838 / DSM 41398 / FERM P-419 / JCM 4703 / NBRC 107858) TaxID=1081613 RepID=A0A0B5EZY1_STRA4|nr:hypothetical protein SLNWT_3795 [Streptomyces albus]AOU78477.1 hypothetical protein SLNHY_3786 [Streptomyces albus]AYN34222.1 hypothetical protein DUI70_3722 [Streptomyces albus]